MEKLGAALDGDILSRRRYRPKKEGQTGFLMLEGMVQAAIGGPLESPPTSPTGDNTAAFTRTCTPSSSTSSRPPAPCTPGPSSLPAERARRRRRASAASSRWRRRALDARAFWAVRERRVPRVRGVRARGAGGRSSGRRRRAARRDAAGDEYCERVVVVGFEESPVPAPQRPFFDAASIAPVVHTRGYASRFDEACPLVMRTELPLLGDRAFIRGMQWVQPAAEHGGGGGCVVHSRVELCVTMLGAGGLVEKFLEQKFREEFEATGRRAEEFVAERGKAGGARRGRCGGGAARARALRQRRARRRRRRRRRRRDRRRRGLARARADGRSPPPLPRKSVPADGGRRARGLRRRRRRRRRLLRPLGGALRRRFARRERELRIERSSTLDGI